MTDDARSPARREAAFAPEASVTAYLQEKLWDALGMEYAGSWSTNRGKAVSKKWRVASIPGRLISPSSGV